MEKEMEKKLMAEASFKPVTNKRPQTARQMAEGDDQNPFNVVERLYEYQEQKKQKQARLEQQLEDRYSFTPTVYSERPVDDAYMTRVRTSSPGQFATLKPSVGQYSST